METASSYAGSGHFRSSAEMLASVDRTAGESLRRRFFVSKRGFSEKEKAFFLNVDFVNHVALVAAINESNRPAIVGGGRDVLTEPGKAEVAFVVIDAYQGVGAMLMRPLASLARAAGLDELAADVPLRIPPCVGCSASMASGPAAATLTLTESSR